MTCVIILVDQKKGLENAEGQRPVVVNERFGSRAAVEVEVEVEATQGDV